jgi:outer membrane receptor protein involved in Fe transport
MKKCWRSTALICCTIGLSLHADDAVKISDLVVTATKSAQSIEEVPSSVTVINREQIELSDARTVDELLTSVPGVYAARMDVSAPNRIAQTYTRGMPGSGRTLVLIDGVPMNSQFDGQVDWSQLATQDIERVEIVRGVGSGLYGSNAMGGIINIITRQPDEGFHATVQGEYGSNNTKTLSGSMRGRSDALGYSLSGSKLTSDGYDMWTDTYKKLLGDKAIAIGTEKTNVSGKLTYDVTDNDLLDLSVSYLDDISTGFYDVPDYLPQERQQWLSSLRYQHFSDHIETSVLVYGRFGKQYADTANRTYTDIATESTYDDQTLGINTNAVLNYFDHHQISIGADYSDGSIDVLTDRYTSEQTRKGYVSKLGVFIQDQMNLNDLTINLAGRVDYWKTHGRQSDTLAGQPEGDYPERDGTEFSPKLSLLYKLIPSLNMRASVGKAFKLPELMEFYSSSTRGTSTYWGNPNLRPETVLGYELGMDYYFSNSGFLKATFYYNNAEDFIYSVRRDAQNFDKMNIDEVVTQGVEVEARYRPVSSLELSASYTYNDSQITKNQFNPELEGKQLTYVPQQQANLNARYDLLSSTTLLASIEHVGKRYANDANTAYYSPYTIYNAGITYRFSPMFTVKANVNNIADDIYEGIGYLAPGRTYSASLQANF